MGSPATILVVDDEPSVLRYMRTLLEVEDYHVETAASGREALARIEKEPVPDLVLLDITMPQLDGIGTLRAIMEQDPNAKVVIISSLGNKEMVWKAIGLGAKSFLTKPLNADYAALVIGDVVRGEGGGAR